MKRTSALPVAALCAATLLLAGCAGPNPAANSPDAAGHVAGFWEGLLHGAIAWPAFFVSLFRPDVGIYEAHNNGMWYNLGYLLGLGAFSGSSASAARRPKAPANPPD